MHVKIHNTLDRRIRFGFLGVMQLKEGRRGEERRREYTDCIEAPAAKMEQQTLFICLGFRHSIFSHLTAGFS
jgi:hypothetical protein